jgi:hypothetical protein
MALLFRWFGDRSAFYKACALLEAIAAAAMVALFPVVSAAIGMGVATGIIAALFWLAARPPLFPLWETYFTALFAILGTYLFCRYTENNTPNIRAAVSLGFVTGLLLLLNQVCGLVILAWISWIFWQRKLDTFKFPHFAILLIPILMVGPWTLRNFITFKRVIVLRDNLGLELAISNNDCASVSYELNHKTGCFDKLHPDLSSTEAARVREWGEPRYNDVRLREAVEWIGSHPERFAALSAQRSFAFWMPVDSANPFPDLIHSGQRKKRATNYLKGWATIHFLTLLGVLGLPILFRQNLKGFVLCVLWLGLYPPVYYVIQFIDRYRYPIMWVTFLLGALPLKIVLMRVISSWKSRM